MFLQRDIARTYLTVQQVFLLVCINHVEISIALKNNTTHRRLTDAALFGVKFCETFHQPLPFDFNFSISFSRSKMMCQGRSKWSVSQNLILILSLIQFPIICQFSLSCIPYSLRTADAFPVVAWKSDDRKCVCGSQATFRTPHIFFSSFLYFPLKVKSWDQGAGHRSDVFQYGGRRRTFDHQRQQNSSS